MITSFLRSIALVATLAVGATAMTAAPASANSGVSIGIKIGDRHAGYRGKRHYRPHRVGCDAREALRKAGRVGIRHARIARMNRRVVEVAGRSGYRGHAQVRFARERGCPVIALRR